MGLKKRHLTLDIDGSVRPVSGIKEAKRVLLTSGCTFAVLRNYNAVVVRWERMSGKLIETYKNKSAN